MGTGPTPSLVTRMLRSEQRRRRISRSHPTPKVSSQAAPHSRHTPDGAGVLPGGGKAGGVGKAAALLTILKMNIRQLKVK